MSRRTSGSPKALTGSHHVLMPEIRAAVDADAGELLTLQRAAWVPEAQLHKDLDMPPLTQTLDSIRADIATKTVLVAVENGRLIATARAELIDETWMIGRLGVVPDLQGRGLGSGMLQAIEAAAPPNARGFHLSTGPLSVRNVQLYERHGYRQVPAEDILIHLAKEKGPTHVQQD